jgi:glycine/D-amino acid oxidase-like deaminating enzyme
MDIESAWDLLDEIRKTANLQTPVWQFTGYAAIATHEEFLVHLRNNALRKKAGLLAPLILVSDAWQGVQDIPAVYSDLYRLLPKHELLTLIETADEDYFAVLPEQKGCMNSALFCEELAGYLLAQYPDRFKLAEQTPVEKLILETDYAILETTLRHKVKARHVVLCTNGFEKIQIINRVGGNINKKFHHLVRGIVGYMAGYTEDTSKPPAEISFLPKSDKHGSDVYSDDPYFYLTRRPYEVEGYQNNLVSIGGPEALMDDTNNYKVEHPFPAEAREQIDSFLRYTYKHGHQDQIEYKFLWHGLMGFTPNGVRLVGPEPLNPLLYYNLGCNGVGLMPSIFGGKKIARLLAGEKLPPSLFDPKDLTGSDTPRVAQPRKLKYLHRHRISIKHHEPK